MCIMLNADQEPVTCRSQRFTITSKINDTLKGVYLSYYLCSELDHKYYST